MDARRRPTRTEILRLAAAAGCDPRTAERALTEGPDRIRSGYVRDRLAAAMGELDPACRAGAHIGD